MRALKTGEECLEGEPVIVTSLECSSTRVRAWVKPPSAVAGRGGLAGGCGGERIAEAREKMGEKRVAVSGTGACRGAMEAMKILAGFGKPLLGRMARLDLRDMSFEVIQVARREDCAVCAGP